MQKTKKNANFLTEWQVSYAGSKIHWVGFMNRAESADEAALMSLNSQTRSGDELELTEADLTNENVYYRNGVRYERTAMADQPRSTKMGVVRAIDDNDDSEHMLLLPVEQDDQPMYQWDDELPRYQVKIKWTCLKEDGSVAAVHILEDITPAENMSQAALGFIGRIISDAMNLSNMDYEALEDLMGNYNPYFQKGLNKYEVVSVGYFKRLSLDIVGHEGECITPLHTETEQPQRAYLINKRGDLHVF